MRAGELDWDLLRGSVVLLVVSLVVAGVALAASYHFWNKQETALERERSALLTARSQYQALDDEEDIIATYLPRYVALEAEGIIGREQRLDWIDVLRESARAVQVPRLEYVIAAQRPFETGMLLNVGDYGVYASSMRLDVGLLHEGDLLELLGRLRREVSGLFGVSGCRMMRTDRELRLAPDASNVEAQCVLNFYTIRRSDAAGGGSAS